MQVGGYSVRRGFVDWLDENYDPAWSQRYVRDQHKALFGVEIKPATAKAVIDFVGGTDAGLGGTESGTTRETIIEISAATPSEGYVGMSLDEWMR